MEDITPPAKVQNLMNSTPTATAIDLWWAANTEPDLVGYKVYQNGSLLGTTTNTYYNVTGLSQGTTYEFNVSAYDDNGLEGENASVTVTTATYPDTTPPTVTDWAPTGTDVAITTNITATFSEPMNESTLNNEMIIVENSTGSAIAGAVTYDSATRTVTFDPTTNLEYNETYNVTITTGVADLAGNHLAAHKTWNFTTRSEVMEATISIGNANFDDATAHLQCDKCWCS